MAAIPCQDTSTPCLSYPRDISLHQNQASNQLRKDTKSADCNAKQNPQMVGTDTGKMRKKQPVRQTDVTGESTTHSAALEPSTTANSCLTRRARLDREKAARAASRQDKCEAGRSRTPKRRFPDGGTPTDQACSGHPRHTDQTAVEDVAAANMSELPDTDRNSNANKEQAQASMNLNVNASKTRRKKGRKARKARVPARRPKVRKQPPAPAPAPVSGTRLVNFSALKPISATCSRSGLNLVVTYRPVFSQVTRKKRAKKPTQSACRPRNANNNVQSTTVCQRDFGTSPRTPSPQKQRKKESSFFEQIAAFTKKTKGSEREKDVEKWLDDVPQSNSPRIRRHRSPSPSRRKKQSTDKAFTTAKLSGRKTAIPGPSWAPDELTEEISRSNSALYLVASGSGARRYRPPTHRRGSKRRAASPGAKMDEAFSGNLGKTNPTKGQASSTSKLHSKANKNESWKATGSESPDRKSLSPRAQRAGGRGSRSPRRSVSEAEDTDQAPAQRDHATSVSRTGHYVVPESRSHTRSSGSSHSPGSRESKEGDSHNRREGDPLGEHSRHHRHRRRQEWPENSNTGAGVCRVM